MTFRLSARGVGLALLAAGATALTVAAQARRAERENPGRGHFLTVDGVRLHAMEMGHRGPPVVLLHGNGAMVEEWLASGLPQLLARRHRVLMLDRPGFGHSERPRGRAWTAAAQAAVLRQAWERLGFERPILLGHSWGTLVALSLALRDPGAVRGLVLLAGYYFPSVRADVAIFSPPAIPLLGDVLRYTLAPPLGRLIAPKLISRIFAPLPVPARFKAEFPLPLALRPSQIRASAGDTARMVPTAAALAPRYGRLRLPVAIIAGEGDRIVKARQAERLHELLPQSRLVLLPGIGHMLHHAAPEAVAAVVTELAGTAALAA